MTYKINGVEISLQPTSGRWINRHILGIDGNGHPVYSAVREFELSWKLMSEADFSQLVGFFNSVSITGSAVVDLPEFGASSYNFFSYSGCVIQEPTLSEYFVEHPTTVKLRIINIRT